MTALPERGSSGGWSSVSTRRSTVSARVLDRGREIERVGNQIAQALSKTPGSACRRGRGRADESVGGPEGIDQLVTEGFDCTSHSHLPGASPRRSDRAGRGTSRSRRTLATQQQVERPSESAVLDDFAQPMSMIGTGSVHGVLCAWPDLHDVTSRSAQRPSVIWRYRGSKICKEDRVNVHNGNNRHR